MLLNVWQFNLCFFFSFQICLKFQSPSKMAGRLTVQERAQIAARYEVWRSIVEVQRWWRTINGRHAQIDPRMIKNCHAKLMTREYFLRDLANL